MRGVTQSFRIWGARSGGLSWRWDGVGGACRPGALSVAGRRLRVESRTMANNAPGRHVPPRRVRSTLRVHAAAEEAFAVVEGNDLAGGEAALRLGETDEGGGGIG